MLSARCSSLYGCLPTTGSHHKSQLLVKCSVCATQLLHPTALLLLLLLPHQEAVALKLLLQCCQLLLNGRLGCVAGLQDTTAACISSPAQRPILHRLLMPLRLVCYVHALLSRSAAKAYYFDVQLLSNQLRWCC